MKTVKLLTSPEKNAHLVKQAFQNAEERHGKAWHLLSAGVRESLVYAEAFQIIAMQSESSPMVDFANDVIREYGARENA